MTSWGCCFSPLYPFCQLQAGAAIYVPAGVLRGGSPRGWRSAGALQNCRSEGCAAQCFVALLGEKQLLSCVSEPSHCQHKFTRCPASRHSRPVSHGHHHPPATLRRDAKQGWSSAPVPRSVTQPRKATPSACEASGRLLPYLHASCSLLRGCVGSSRDGPRQRTWWYCSKAACLHSALQYVTYSEGNSTQHWLQQQEKGGPRPSCAPSLTI